MCLCALRSACARARVRVYARPSVCVRACARACVRACVRAYGLSFGSFCAPCAQLSRWHITCRQRRWANRLPATASLPLTENALPLACLSIYASARMHASARTHNRTDALRCYEHRCEHIHAKPTRHRTADCCCAHACDHVDSRSCVPSGDLHVVIAFLHARHRW